MSSAPGSFVVARERWAPFTQLVPRIGAGDLVLADRRVLALHPTARRALARHRVIELAAGERVKSLAQVERLARATLDLPRTATVFAIGGGTLGDLATVWAHLHKRGVRLVHVPTTVLAAVDSSVGGKGAVDVAGAKNALGVFHAPVETWLCTEWFTTLSEEQRQEGRIEAWKVALTDAPTWRAWVRRAPSDLALLRTARAKKTGIVARDPYERRRGVRSVLNFGHTFGHVFETLSRYRVRHGLAVGLGIRCALDVGIALGVTPRVVAEEVEAALPGPREPRARIDRKSVV